MAGTDDIRDPRHMTVADLESALEKLQWEKSLSPRETFEVLRFCQVYVGQLQGAIKGAMRTLDKTLDIQKYGESDE